MGHYERSAYRGPIRGVILDWAGTVVDYGSFAPTAVFLRLFENHGVKITAEDARSGMGLMKKDHLRTILARPSVCESWKIAHDGASPTEMDVDLLFESFIPMQLAVVQDYAGLIPGLLETMKELRRREIKIGSTTGYIRKMMDVLAPRARELGYEPDCIVCPDDVPAGRPAPFMCYLNAARLGVFPLESMVKVGDTQVDIEEGLNAGMWTVGLSLTGNLVGKTQAEVDSLSATQRNTLRKKAEDVLLGSGAHMVIDGIWDLNKALGLVTAALVRGRHPRDGNL